MNPTARHRIQSRSLEGMLPGILIGEKVRIRHAGDAIGSIEATGHQYGPGDGHDQAQVHFKSWHPGDPDSDIPKRRRGRWQESWGWYYLESLEITQNAELTRPEAESNPPDTNQ